MGLLHRLSRLIRPRPIETITRRSSLCEIENTFPGFIRYLNQRFLAPVTDLTPQIGEYCARHNLPSPEIVIAEFQVSSTLTTIQLVSAEAIRKRLDEYQILDVRESWERRYGSVPGAQPLTKKLLSQIVSQWPPQTPLLVYCHFGIRSVDAAVLLAKNGFTHVCVLQGGIDAWSSVDPHVTRYEHAWC